ncbi:probable carboxylesterase 5 [Henckelia pumila]|uniref:probable carboxylesterase 5 n=1 Tax=Henckelia pumila TaxID=405737 RepID=UPI003C6DCFE4
MDHNSDNITHDFPPFFRVHDTGRVERYVEHDFLPPSKHPKTGVVSKDVVVSPRNNVTARIYLPRTESRGRKLPLIIYVHGGGFSIESAFSSRYHNYVGSLAAESRSVVVSVEYRLAPEHPIPACYEDCWAATKWVVSHSRVGQGEEPWMTDHVDFGRVFVAGDSAGANIAHEMVVRSGAEPESGIKIAGMVLIHPFFGNGNAAKIWDFICPGTTGPKDPRLYPAAHRKLLSNLRCERVLVCVAEKDLLKERGVMYHQALKKSDWNGLVELFETHGEGHVFHLLEPESQKAPLLMKRVVEFINKEFVPSLL